MLKKNLFQKLTSAVLAMCFCICSVGSVCSASYKGKKFRGSDYEEKKPRDFDKGKKFRGSDLTADDIEAAYDHATKGNNLSDGYDNYDYNEYDCYPEEDYEHKNWGKSALNDLGNKSSAKVDEKVGNNVFTNEEENNNLDNNNNHSADAEENSNQNGSTAINNDNQNNAAISQNVGHRGYQESWYEKVFGDDNNE